jgi:acylphosphatase
MVSAAETVRLTAWVRGRVQGVGMRWWIRARALELGLAGWARNTPDGRVEIVAEGAESACRELLRRLAEPGPPGRVDTVIERWSAARKNLPEFEER